jgi:phospholipase C
MLTRRDFLQTAAALGSTGFIWGVVPEVIARAASINPAPGSTFRDAKHVVILMQENRSFDHTFGAMRGVRGFRDPRPHLQPTDIPVWFQPDGKGGFIPPFRLDIEGSNVTWIGGNAHSWHDQIDANNSGKYDNWLHAKRRGDGFPMTMGFFAREDIPFYYALADSFTLCDQAFCSSLTGTTPNRLHLWTGTIREDANHPARVLNDDTDYGVEAAWTTFPERLEEAGVSWKIYQNELSIDSGLVDEHDAWLTNFTDNPLEWFSQYKVRYLESRRSYVTETGDKLAAEIKDAEGKALDAEAQAKLEKQKKQLAELLAEKSAYTAEGWEALGERDKALHRKAFDTNSVDSNYRTLVEHDYHDGDAERKVGVPKGDVLAQFRKDVESGQLPEVSWLIAPERFSDHPGSAWFGAWYLSETLHILTQNPEVWKETVFILCYDENDGYFDHVPPFTAPHPGRPETGKTSGGLDTAVDISNAHNRDHSIGLGFRVPLLVASPWSRGGAINSQVCDHTSIIMFVETWLAGKGKAVKETNISDWHRTVCGDLTSAFRPYHGGKVELPEFLDRDAFIERIDKARFKHRPVPGSTLARADLDRFKIESFQEHGSRPSCPLPYRLEASLEPSSSGVAVRMTTGKGVGSAFNAYVYGPDFTSRAYAVKAGDTLEDELPGGGKRYRVNGPNGFLRELVVSDTAPFSAAAKQHGASLEITLKNLKDSALPLEVHDLSYGASGQKLALAAHGAHTLRLSTEAGKHWYDFGISADGCAYRFAGRLEDGQWSVTDPAFA